MYWTNLNPSVIAWNSRVISDSTKKRYCFISTWCHLILDLVNFFLNKEKADEEEFNKMSDDERPQYFMRKRLYRAFFAALTGAVPEGIFLLLFLDVSWYLFLFREIYMYIYIYSSRIKSPPSFGDGRVFFYFSSLYFSLYSHSVLMIHILSFCLVLSIFP